MGLLSIRSFSKFLGVMLLGLFVLGFHTSDAQANAAWKTLRGHSACGGIDQYGKLQPPCDFEKATYIKQAIKTCPKGSFAAAGACHTCPTGFKRNILRKVTGEKACRKAVSTQTSAAKLLGSASCPSGSKFDPRNGGECWRCPSGFGRTAAAVDKWNACGKIGKKAQSATFVGRSCPAKGSIRDPRKGGECWTCPEDYSRTGNPVTGARACKTNFAFAKANQVSDKKCGPGEIHDIIDGGTCWTCPTGTKRTIFHGIKTAKACRNNQMQWVMPTRQVYGLFGLGAGAEDILAKLITDRSQIDAAIKKLAEVSGEDQVTALKETWEIIDTRPEHSVILSSVLGQYIIEAAAKPTSQQTTSEKDLLNRMAQLIQWNRQFIAYQAKQAHENFMAASEASREELTKKAGAAAIYFGSGPTPPNYNEALVASIQAGAILIGPAAAATLPLLSTSTKAVLFPFRKMAVEVIKEGVKQTVQQSGRAIVGGMSTGSTIGAAALAPMAVAMAAGVIVTMEFDKLMAMEKAEGQIRQSIAIADRTVNIGTLLQQKKGGGEFLFHWASVVAANTKPSANFNRLLTAYKSGTTPTTSSLELPSGISSTPEMTTGTTSVETTSGGTLSTTQQVEVQPTPAPAPVELTLAELVEKAAIKQKKRAPKGAMRIELSNRAGLCLTKKSGNDLRMTIDDCRPKRTLWINPIAAHDTLAFAKLYCLRGTDPKKKTSDQRPKKIRIAECNDNSPRFKWKFTQKGFIQQLNGNRCITVDSRKNIVLQDCGTDMDNQIWRPWKR